ncbi:FAD-dependent monooxygenase [Micromonospora sp. NPDC003197]
MSRRAGIIGGGIGGLATGIMLHRAGWSVRVFERAGTPGGTGTALGMWPEALRALDAMGLGDAVRAIGTRQRSGDLLRPDGSRITTIDVAAMARRTGEAVHLISRPALLRLLAEALPTDLLSLDTEISDVAALQREYDVVVVADGIFSQTRTALFGPTSQARYVGCTAWRGTVDGAIDTVNETWGRGKRFGITPREDGRTNWFATVRTAEGGRSPAGEVAALRAHFGDWHEGVRRVLAGLHDEAEVLRHDIYDLHPPLPTFVRGNAVVVGDAAHAMTPDLGRGACEALVDAVTLAGHLDRAPDVRSALAAYDQERRRPVQRLARLARTMNRMTQVRRFVPLRDIAVRAALAVGGPPS